jgi:hypothetical protein
MILSFWVATITPHPVPQKRHTALSQRHPVSPAFVAASTSLGKVIPTATAAALAALAFKNSLRLSCIIDPF